MNYKLIMLPNPILVSDEKPKNIVYVNNHIYNHEIRRFTLAFGNSNVKDCKEVIAGIEGLPKLDLSAIAEEIGWVDVEKLAEENADSFVWDFESPEGSGYIDHVEGFKEGFKAAQSLNEKKYSEKDLYNLLKLIGQKGYYVECDGTVYAKAFDGGDVVDVVKEYSESVSKPKEYLVEVEMEDIGNKDKVYNCSSKSEWIPKITNNTIKVTKIIAS